MQVMSDHDLEKAVHEQLIKVGASPDRIQVFVDEAKVTLCGTVQFEAQRRTFLKAASTVDGVAQVIDKLLLAMPRK